MRCNTRWILNPAELAHLTEPRLSAMRRQLKSDENDITTAPLGLYFCFDPSTGRSTLLTFGLGLLHQHVCEQFKDQDVYGVTRRESTNPLEDPFLLILAWCRRLVWVFEEIAALWCQRDEIYVSPSVRLLISYFRTEPTGSPSLAVGEGNAGVKPCLEPQGCGIPTSNGRVYARLVDVISRFPG